MVGFAELTEEEPIMDKLFDFGNRYARESTWKDFALVKILPVLNGTGSRDTNSRKT